MSAWKPETWAQYKLLKNGTWERSGDFQGDLRRQTSSYSKNTASSRGSVWYAPIFDEDVIVLSPTAAHRWDLGVWMWLYVRIS